MIRSFAALVLVASLGGLAAGCMATVHLSDDRLAPAAPTASYRERRASFVALRPEGLDVTHILYNDRMFGRHEQYVTAMHLADQTAVYSPEVLLSAIEPESPTARSIARYDVHRRHANRRLWISRGFAIAGGAILGVALALRDDDAQFRMAMTGTGFLLGWAGTRFALRRSMRHRDRSEYEAYLSYDGDLADHLDVCAEGDAVRECP